MSTPLPLAGTRIVSLEQFGAGPYGTMILADLGAEVIKIENPAIGGDPARYTGPFALGEADSQYFQTWNLNKRSIVCVHISAYGRDNERAAWPGYDYLMQAESGLMSLTGEPEGPPSRFGAPSMIDHMTGMTAMVGLLAALLHARASGKGCDVDVSLHDV